MTTKILCDDGWKKLKDHVICEVCDKPYPEIWMVPSQLWEKITGKTDGRGFMCMSCFDQLAREQNIFLSWTCKPLRHMDTKYLYT